MFQVLNTRTNQVKLSTPDLEAANIMVDRENFLEVNAGCEPCWEVRYLVLGKRGVIAHTYRVTIEEL